LLQKLERFKEDI
jgi:hypothetical protein